MLREIRTLTFLSIEDAKRVLELAIDSIAQAEDFWGFAPDEPFMSMNDVINDVLCQFELEIDEMPLGYIKERATYLQRLKDIQHSRVKQC
ncbi:hypothetical protein OPU71_04360 [Niveibacterium sp. 24ML]|uniref:hypothetical protein n=1 Tax=Niveibacterium sp. 24ML TaxID=2985512 RepID=UPI00227123FE|nr:hypothetical protein [Niveibacterium sp. 24ML]MCX9155350.1 hypothetical protein [Niveibacterium sp. 24ML]